MDRGRMCSTRLLRSGLTVVELLVSIAVIGLLLSLAIPAVQGARESSRSVTCTNHLSQIGKALAAFEAQHQCWPRGLDKYHLLPFVGQRALHDQFRMSDFANLSQSLTPEFWERWNGLARYEIEVYLCPSDPVPTVINDWGATSYAGNSGTGVQRGGEDGMFLARDRPHFLRGVRMDEVTDGLSHTVAMSEILYSDGQWPGTRLRMIWMTPRPSIAPLPLEELARLCDSLPANPSDYGWHGDWNWKGRPWMNAALGTTLYNHVLTPNRPSCTNGGEFRLGVHTSAGMHPGGVNTLYADGRVTFFNESVDSGVWRDAGSRTSIGITPLTAALE